MSKWNRPMTTYKRDPDGILAAQERERRSIPLTKTKAEREAARAQLRAKRARP
jgi:hypothetical protein